ncbi:hypothetical protein ACQZ40_25265 [Agrobacterium sp. 16-172Ci]
MTSSYFAPLVTHPVIITEPGQYRTRAGEVVTVKRASKLNDFGCRGHYQNGVPEFWHRSGRIFVNALSDHDIVSRLEMPTTTGEALS